ncbi:MAG: undecaprenyldiphospho-muramoylpentapeptide beta-N-acetylglucosaminyltransferase [Pseudomonadales bacterium]|nr:undecaprenyldiphospho-muramoylpentapeptide beta-N-acetylglucosaminyltransferase [Pseudomonadales bacterium]
MNTNKIAKKHILIMAGGTGGHVFPGLAVAEQLILLGHEVSWLGTSAGIEAKLVPAAGIELHIIDIAGVRGKGLKGLFLAPFKIVHAVVQSIAVIKKVKADCVLGMGGFAGGPGGVAAKLLAKPLLIHEQNAVAGTTNKILAPLAKRVLQAFPAAFAGNNKATTVGNPVRADIKAVYENDDENLHVLVLGGSLGAKAINELMPELVNVMGTRIQLWHQTGVRHIDDVKALYKNADIKASDQIKVAAFIDDMAAAYAWADVVICRSGAMTVSEIAVAGLPAIFIPYPFAIDDHQTANAKWLVDENAAFLMPQEAMTVASLEKILTSLIDDAQLLKNMQEKAESVAISNASETVAKICLELAS